ncbi:MAG: hypothetical protein ABMA26_04655 [Limisphaerales bacterium]
MSNPQQRIPLMSWWTIWFALLSGLFVIFFVLGNQPGSAGNAQTSQMFLGLGVLQVVASAVVRWVLLPKVQEAARAFPMFVVGMALAEGACFFGIFLVPAYKQELFFASILGVAQFVPFFASRFYEPPKR